MMCPEVDTKQHKKARFFMKTSYFFGENNLKSFFRPGWKGMGDPGVVEEILCTVSDYNPVEFLFFNANSPLRFTFPLYLP